jgi:hypothetical protein
MQRVLVICEGSTEVEFCKELLYPHFLSFEIEIVWSLPKWSGGGAIAWNNLKHQILNTLKNEPNAFVTTFIDLYGLQKPEQFPGWFEANKLKRDPYQRLEFLETCMALEFPEELRFRFIPNYTLHEFEGLLFNDLCHFENLYGDDEFKDKNELISILSQFKNPELINEKKETSPSYRLENQIFKRYSKTVDGILIALDIQLHQIRLKSPHFDSWLRKIEQIVQPK